MTVVEWRSEGMTGLWTSKHTLTPLPRGYARGPLPRPTRRGVLYCTRSTMSCRGPHERRYFEALLFCVCFLSCCKHSSCRVLRRVCQSKSAGACAYAACLPLMAVGEGHPKYDTCASLLCFDLYPRSCAP